MKYSYEELQNILEKAGSYTAAAKVLNMPRKSFTNLYHRAKNNKIVDYVPKADREIIEEAKKIARQKQKALDNNRIERKVWRNSVRIANALEEVEKELIFLLKSKQFNFPTPSVKCRVDKNCGIITLSDLHFNECVSNSWGKYNWDIASRRLRKHIFMSMQHFKYCGVKKVLLAMTGDIFNSNRHLDEILLNATNRANALFIGFSLIRSAIRELSDNGFEVSVTFVAGNESRIEQENYSTNLLASDNFDVMLFHMLRANLEEHGIKFIIPQNVLESVISINNKNILLIHGNFGFTKDINQSIANFINRYSHIGIKIDYVLFGHIHNAQISDLYARSSSMVGNNDYNTYELNIYGRASQNCFIVGKHITGIRNDLEEADIEGYKFDQSEYMESSQNKKIIQEV